MQVAVHSSPPEDADTRNYDRANTSAVRSRASSGRPFSLVTADQEEPSPKTTAGRARAADGTRAYTWSGPNGLVRTIKNTEMWKLAKADFALSQNASFQRGRWTALLTPHPSTAHGAVRATTPPQSGLQAHV